MTVSLVVSNTFSGALTLPGQEHRFTLSGVAGQRLYYDALDLDFEPLNTQLTAPSGNVLWQDNSSIDHGPFHLPETGTYTVLVKALGDVVGDYAFRFLSLQSAPSVAPGNSIPVRLDPPAAAALVRFDGTVGQRISLTNVIASALGATWRLVGPGDTFLAGSVPVNTPLGEVVLPSTGTYGVVVEGGASSGAPLDFTFRLSLVSNPTGTATGLGAVQIGTVAPAATNTFAFTAPAGTWIYYDSLNLTDGPLVADCRAADSSQAFVVSAHSDSGPYFLPSSGDYVLHVYNSDPSTPGNYAFRLLNLASDTVPLPVGSLQTSLFTSGYESRVYQFNAGPGQRLLLDDQANLQGRLTARFMPPSGNVLLTGAWDYFPVTRGEPGSWLLILDSLDPNPLEHRFRLIDTAQSPAIVLPLNTPQSGTLAAYETRVYRFEATTGQQLFLDSRATNSQASWALYGPDDLPQGSGVNSDSEVTIPRGGACLLVIANYYPDSNPYAFTLHTPPAPTTSLSLGTATSGTLTTAGELHRYTFTGTAGQWLFFDALDDDPESISFQLLDPSSQTLLWGNLNYDYGALLLPYTGIYTLVIGGNSDTTGDYAFRLLDLAQAPTVALALDTPVTATPGNGREAHLYRFQGTSAQRLFFNNRSLNANGYWSLYGPDASGLQGSSLATDFGATLPRTGTYALVLTWIDPAPAPFAFTVVTPNTLTPAATLTNVTTGSLGEPGEEHRFPFTGSLGMRIYYDALERDANDVTVRLESPDGAQIYQGNSDDDYGPLTLLQAGSYTLILGGTSDVTAAYQFKLVNLDDGLPLVTTRSGQLNPPSETDVLRVSATAGQTVTLRSLSADGTLASWRLVDRLNQTLAYGLITQDLPSVTLPSTDTYALLIEGTPDNAAPLNYEVEVAFTNPTGTPTGFATVHEGSLGPGEQAEFDYAAPAGSLVFFDSQREANDPLLADWWDPDNNLLWTVNAEADAGPFLVAKSGTHRLVLRGADAGSSGSYRFRLLHLATDSTQLTFGSEVSESLADPFVTAFHRFTGTVGQRIYFDSLLDVGAAMVNWTLISPSGVYRYCSAFGCSSAADAGAITLLENGTHYLGVRNLQSDPSDHRFRLLDAALAPTEPITFGTPKSGTLDPGLQTHLYRLAVTGVTRVYGHSSGTDFNGLWQLYGANDQLLAGSGLTGDFEVSLPAIDGTCLLVVQGTGANPVDYTIEVRAPSTITFPLTVGVTVARSFDQGGDEHRLTFTGTTGQTLYYDALQGDYAVVNVSLLSPTGRLILSGNADDDVGPFTLTESGTYILIQKNTLPTATDYRFRLLDIATATPVVPDTVVAGTLSLGYEARLFTLEPRVGLRWYLDSLTSDPNGYWSVHNAVNTQRAFGGLTSDLELTPDLPATYVVVLNSSSPSPVPYSFQVIPGNHAPVITGSGPLIPTEDVLFTFTPVVTDVEAPNDQLTFSLDPGAPAGLAVDPSSGRISWTPTEAQGPGSYTATVRVRDDGIPNLESTRTFTLAVDEVNRAPTAIVPADQTFDELTLLTVTNRATDPDLPPNALTFSLISPPAGMTIDPASGVVSWTPTEAQGPRPYVVQVRVTDTNPPAINARELHATNQFAVTVREVNVAPVLPLLPTQTIDELVQTRITSTATDVDLPPNLLSYELLVAPGGMGVTPDGALTWTPSEDQGPSNLIVTLRVTDNGVPNLSHTQQVAVVVREINEAPSLASIANLDVLLPSSISLTAAATDPDLPPNTLRFAIASGPTGATLDPLTGAFSWTPTEADLGKHPVTLTVTDGGTPALSDAVSFTVGVAAPPRVATVEVIPGRVRLSWSAAPGFTYGVEYKDDLATQAWTPLPGEVVASGPTATLDDTSVGGRSSRFYRVALRL